LPDIGSVKDAATLIRNDPWTIADAKKLCSLIGPAYTAICKKYGMQ